MKRLVCGSLMVAMASMTGAAVPGSALASAAQPGIAVAAEAQQGNALIVTGRDARNDVVTKVRGEASAKRRQAIDIRRVTIRRHGNSSVIRIKVKKLMRSRAGFGQVFFIGFTPRGSSEFVSTGVLSHRKGAVFRTRSEVRGENCSLRTVRVVPGDVIQMSAPSECLPIPWGARVTVRSSLHHESRPGDPIARDGFVRRVRSDF